jgi:hypothetical protein
MPHVGGQDAHLCRKVAEPPDPLFVVIHAAPAPVLPANRHLAQSFQELANFFRAAMIWWRSTAEALGCCHRMVGKRGWDGIGNCGSRARRTPCVSDMSIGCSRSQAKAFGFRIRPEKYFIFW